MQIRIYETVSQKPRGDRDRARHDCYSYEVVLVNRGNRMTIFENDQYDSVDGSIMGTREAYLQEAMNKADELAVVLGAAEIVGIEATRLEKQMMDLEKIIKESQFELDELKRRSM